MKTANQLGLVSVLVMMMVSCGPAKQTEIENIKDLENEFSSQTEGINRDKAAVLVDAYLGFANQFPGDSLAPEYLFRAADISMNMFDPGKAIDIYNRIINEYPDFRKAPQCIFLKAFVYENNLNDLVNAKRFYTEFLEKYPEDDFADDAQISLDNLGKSPEELIKEFEAKMNQTETEPAEK